MAEGRFFNLSFLWSDQPLWFALLLLGAGMSLLAWPVIKKRWAARAKSPARPATLDERLAKAARIGAERDELDRTIERAREMVKSGCDQFDERIERLERLLERAENHADAEGSPRIVTRGVRISSPPEETIDPLSREVFSLADAGRSSLEIASQLQEHQGKVELMLALRRGGLAAANGRETRSMV